MPSAQLDLGESWRARSRRRRRPSPRRPGPGRPPCRGRRWPRPPGPAGPSRPARRGARWSGRCPRPHSLRSPARRSAPAGCAAPPESSRWPPGRTIPSPCRPCRSGGRTGPPTRRAGRRRRSGRCTNTSFGMETTAVVGIVGEEHVTGRDGVAVALEGGPDGPGGRHPVVGDDARHRPPGCRWRRAGWPSSPSTRSRRG